MTSTRARSMWRRNWWPRPRPFGRALDQPRDVGEHELVVVEAHDTEVRLERGERVVGDLGLRRARPPRSASTCPRSGNPTSAASASSLSSSCSHCSSPYSPCSAKLGARRAFDRNRALPRPPCPPRAASQRSPWRTRSASSSPSRGRTVVPSGTSTTRSAPPLPCSFLPGPCVPDVALRCGWSRNASSDATLRFGPQPDVAAPAAVAAVGTALRHVRLAAERRRSPRRRRRPSRCIARASTNSDTGHCVLAAVLAPLRPMHAYRLRTMRSIAPLGRAARGARWRLAAAATRKSATTSTDDDLDGAEQRAPASPRRPRQRPRPRPRSVRRLDDRPSLRSRVRRRPSPCNAPTMIELHWETAATTNVGAAHRRQARSRRSPSGTHRRPASRSRATAQSARLHGCDGTEAQRRARRAGRSR